MFHKENLYYITLHIPIPHGSLRVAHTTSVHDKYTLHYSFKIFSLRIIQRQSLKTLLMRANNIQSTE